MKIGRSLLAKGYMKIAEEYYLKAKEALNEYKLHKAFYFTMAGLGSDMRSSYHRIRSGELV